MTIKSVITLVSCLTAVNIAAPKVLLAQQMQPNKIAQVQAGTLKEAHASWWGFDKNDATECLQNAINSGASMVIVDNTGSDWIVSKPIQLASNQTIIFEDGVVVQAAKDQFHDKNDSLFDGKNITNLSLIGRGKVLLRMNRDDYANPKLYSKSEWRHGIALWDSSNIVIRNLTVAETGGDGLYLGAATDGVCENILVEDSTFDKNYRQGISIISAENLTIRNCKLTDTAGTMPQAGIDFEPNAPGQRLVNCVIENCEFVNNKGGGLDIYPVRLNKKSEPISIIVRKSTFAGSAAGLNGLITRSTENPVGGSVILEDCTFNNNWLYIRNPILGAATYTFKNCTLNLDDDFKRKDSAVVLAMEKNMGAGTMGGIEFQNVVAEAGNLPLFDLRFQEPFTLSDEITRTISVKNKVSVTPFNLSDFIVAERKKLVKFAQLKDATFDADKLRFPTSLSDAPREGNAGAFAQGKFTFLQYAKQGEEITINVTAQKVYERKTEVELQDPSGEKLQTYEIPYDSKPHSITFTAQQTGVYRLVRTQDFSQRIDINSAHPGNGFLINDGMTFLPTKGRLYFEVPAGVKDFTIGITTDSAANAVLFDAQGNEVQRAEGIKSLYPLSASRADATKAEIWSVELSHAVWAVTLKFYGDLQPIVATNPQTLLRSVQ